MEIQRPLIERLGCAEMSGKVRRRGLTKAGVRLEYFVKIEGFKLKLIMLNVLTRFYNYTYNEQMVLLSLDQRDDCNNYSQTKQTRGSLRTRRNSPTQDDYC